MAVFVKSSSPPLGRHSPILVPHSTFLRGETVSTAMGPLSPFTETARVPWNLLLLNHSDLTLCRSHGAPFLRPDPRLFFF